MYSEETWVSNGTLPAISTSEPNSPSARANARPLPPRRAGTRLGKTTRRKMVSGWRPSDAAACSISWSSSMQHGLHGPDDERQRHKQQRHDDAGAGEGDVDAERAAGAVEGQQREPGDDGGQGEGQVDERVDQPLPGNRSRTRTHAMSVPMTALTATTTSEQPR